MIKERNNFVNIREILARVTSHPMLKNVDLEQAIRYTVDFLSIVGCPTFYLDKEIDITFQNINDVLGTVIPNEEILNVFRNSSSKKQRRKKKYEK